MNGRMARAAKVGVPSIAGLALVLLGGVAAPVATGQDAGTQEPVQQVDRTFAYTCTLPDGTVPVTLHVTATLPERAVAGRSVEAADATLTVTVPPAGFAGLPGATAATAVVRWDNAILSEGPVETTAWTSAMDKQVAVPADADAVFTGPVDLPPVATRTAGDVELAASVLTVTITGYPVDGAATEPSTAELSCELDEDQNAGVVVVSVAAAPRDTSSPDPTPERRQPERPADRPQPPAGEIPKECHQYDGIPAKFKNWYCANLIGYANVNKLNASVLQPAGIQNIAAAPSVFPCLDGPKPPLMLCIYARVLPDYEGESKLPPAPGSFRTFGFVPTTGSMQLTQLGPAETHSWSTITLPYEGLTTIKAQLSVRILNHPKPEINGVPLDVGPNCHSSVPIDAVLYGDYPDYSISLGGPIYGSITVPPFRGCGVTEDLDPIITGLVSGPDNYVKMTQGAVCYFGNGSGECPPPVPEPER